MNNGALIRLDDLTKTYDMGESQVKDTRVRNEKEGFCQSQILAKDSSRGCLQKSPSGITTVMR